MEEKLFKAFSYFGVKLLNFLKCFVFFKIRLDWSQINNHRDFA